MSKNIHIENLQIRLSGSSAARARNVGNGLGDEILKQIVGTAARKQRSVRIENLNAGKISVGQNISETALRGQIARRIADVINERMK